MCEGEDIRKYCWVERQTRKSVALPNGCEWRRRWWVAKEGHGALELHCHRGGDAVVSRLPLTEHKKHWTSSAGHTTWNWTTRWTGESEEKHVEPYCRDKSNCKYVALSIWARIYIEWHRNTPALEENLVTYLQPNYLLLSNLAIEFVYTLTHYSLNDKSNRTRQECDFIPLSPSHITRLTDELKCCWLTQITWSVPFEYIHGWRCLSHTKVYLRMLSIQWKPTSFGGHLALRQRWCTNNKAWIESSQCTIETRVSRYATKTLTLFEDQNAVKRKF